MTAVPYGIVVSSSITPPFGGLSSCPGYVTHALLALAPLYSLPEGNFRVRLACFSHAASVRSEPGSNSSLNIVPSRKAWSRPDSIRPCVPANDCSKADHWSRAQNRAWVDRKMILVGREFLRGSPDHGTRLWRAPKLKILLQAVTRILSGCLSQVRHPGIIARRPMP